MRIAIPLLALAAAISMAASGPALSPEGLGPLKIGMTVDEARKAAPAAVIPTESSDDLEICGDYLVGDHMSFLTESGRVARISLSGSGATAEGVAIGDPAARVHEVYAKAVQREHAPYADPPAHDLYVWLSPERGYRFEIDDKGKVVVILAGDHTIRYMEGCA